MFRSLGKHCLFTAVVAGLLCATAGHADNQTPPEVDACKLVTAKQAAHILGTAVAAKEQNTSAAGPGSGSVCVYSTGRVNGGFMLLAGHEHYTDAAKAVAEYKKNALLDTPTTMGKPKFIDVNGIGDAAYLEEMPGFFQLHVLDKGAVVVVSRNTDADDRAIARVEKIAQLALGGLGG